MNYNEYVAALIDNLWAYAEQEFGDRLELLERSHRDERRPPKFKKLAADHNLLCPPNASESIQQAIRGAVPAKKRHQHFASMRSSQALAQSVFGGLMALNKVGVLRGLETDEGLPALFDGVADSTVTLEYAIDYLGEPRPTEVDVWFEGAKRVAVECKFTEREFGRCSRPELNQSRHRNYERDHCVGNYTHQRGRTSRCSLTEIGVRYWEYMPSLFGWSAEVDARPCPLRDRYQLARNILAACVRPNGGIDLNAGHALVIYDARNPEFRPGGKADHQWVETKQSLRKSDLLRRCSWQQLIGHLSRDSELDWLVQQLGAKFCLEPSTN